jgi:hypothetical protein
MRGPEVGGTARTQRLEAGKKQTDARKENARQLHIGNPIARGHGNLLVPVCAGRLVRGCLLGSFDGCFGFCLLADDYASPLRTERVF